MCYAELPKPKNHFTPRLLVADAYTIGSNKFESEAAKEKSVYYITFRRKPSDFGPLTYYHLYKFGDDRYVFYGLQKILDYLFYDPITHEEIDLAKKFLADKKITTNGLTEFEFPEEIWREVVDKYNGRPPILIQALREGSVFYPHEPIIQITSQVKGMGVLAAWFESKLLQIWDDCEFVTQNEHWLLYCKLMVRRVHKTSSDDVVDELARQMVHNFGDRAGMNQLESELLGEAYLLTFSGTDTFSGAYQAWMNSDQATGIAMTVNALAHRNVQSYVKEGDCYRTLYDKANNGEILSNVADCYSFKNAVKKYLLPLAIESQTTGNNKIIVARPDSGDALEQVLWVCNLAKENGLYKEVEIDRNLWYFPTTLKFIEGDGMTWNQMRKINAVLLYDKFPPFAWGLYGIGGTLRNNLKRDNASAKYALCAIGNDYHPVVKFSEVEGKATLPGPFKVRRDQKSLENGETVAFYNEEGEDVLIEYFNGLRKEKPFGIGQDDNFLQIKNRVKEQMKNMPLNLKLKYKKYPATDKILEEQQRLLTLYTPKETFVI